MKTIYLDEMKKRIKFGDFMHVNSNLKGFTGWYMVLEDTKAGITTANKHAWSSDIFQEENVDKVIFLRELDEQTIAYFLHDPENFEDYYIITKKSDREKQLNYFINDLQNKLREATEELESIKKQ
jgi:hypothetical protein